MRSDLFTVALLLFSTTPSLAAPQPVSDVQVIARDNAFASIESRDSTIDAAKDLWKRKGGGGGGGKGSGGGSSGSSGSSGKGGSSSGSTSSGSGTGSSAGRGNNGGATRSGSGVQPSFGGAGGGKFYGGGSKTPYKAGGRSPGGVRPVFLGVAALAIFPGIWLAGAYMYPYHNPYGYYNRSARRNQTNTRREILYPELVNLAARQEETGGNETKPVKCLCAENAVCGCDDNGDTTFLDGLIGDGSYAGLNKSVINVVDVNGTSTIVLNGTLPDGTTVADPSAADNSDPSAAANNSSSAYMLQASGYWVLFSLVGFSVYFM